MTRRFLTPLLAALALAVAAPAMAQTAPAAPGLAIADVSAWIASKGGEVLPVQRREGETWLTVKDGNLTWLIFFYGCTNDVCGDIQFAASFSNPSVTMAMVNDWNRDHRFLKGTFFPGVAGQDPTALVQYDLLLTPGGVDQLNDPAAIWVDMVEAFAQTTGYFAAPPAAQ
ncbi:MAG: YbjN domain-containing protein [Pseudomonadota bacterium]